MKPAAFTLKNVFYPEIVVRANDAFDYDDKRAPALPALKIHLFRTEDGNYQVALDLQKPVESGADAYEIKALAIGVFKANPDMSATDQTATVMMSGPNIVYGALRDHIASITARGPWNEYYLPAVILDHEDFASNGDPDDFGELTME